MGMGLVADTPSAPANPEPPRRRPRWARALVGMLIVVVAVWVWQWKGGGPHLPATGAGYGAVTDVGTPVSFGTDLTTSSGHSVVLDGASTKVPAGLTVRWSVFDPVPGGAGMGIVHGPVAGQPIKHHRVAH